MESSVPPHVLEGAAQVERLRLAHVERDALLNCFVDEAETVCIVACRQRLEGQHKGLVTLRGGFGKSWRLALERMSKNT